MFNLLLKLIMSKEAIKLGEEFQRTNRRIKVTKSLRGRILLEDVSENLSLRAREAVYK